MQALIRLLYSLLVAGAVVTFVGFGVYSLYQPPKYPDYPNYNNTDYSDAPDSPYQQQETAYQKATDQYDKDKKAYYKNVTYAVLPLALFFLAIGLIIFDKSEVVGEGVALGGIATSIYGIVTASMADARILRFLAVTLLLLSVLLVTYRRFLHQKA